MAASAELRFNIGPYGKSHILIFSSETAEGNSTKFTGIYKICSFHFDPTKSMASSAEHS